MTTDSEDTTELLSKTTIEFSAYKKGGVLYVNATLPSSGKHWRSTIPTPPELSGVCFAPSAIEVLDTIEMTRLASVLLRSILDEIMEQYRRNS